MVFKTLNLARQSLAKTFTHGYAQSVVAASQSSYASQNTPFGALRFGKSGSHQVQNGYHSTSNQANASSKAGGHHDHSDPLAHYYAAWQKHQRVEDKEWQQFQFAGRIEWKAPPAALESKAKAREDVAAPEGTDPAPTRTAVDRAYSASAVDDFKNFVGSEEAEAAALAKVDEAIAEEIVKAQDEVKAHVQAPATATATPTPTPGILREREGSPLQTPATGSEVTSETPAFSEETKATSVSEAEVYAEQLSKLAENQHYAEIPAVFESMLVEGIKPSVSAYNALLVAAIKLPRAKHQIVPKALDVYSDMLRRRVLPDITTYTVLIELLSTRALDVVGMKQVLEEKRTRYGGLEEEGKFMLHSNETESAILAEDNSLSVAVKLFDASAAIHSERAFSERTYRLLLSACAEEGRVDDMVRIYTHMESQNVTPRADMFVPMIHAFGTSGDLRSAVECYNEYKALAIANDNGELALIRKDNDVYAALVKAYVICGRPQGGVNFLAKIEAEAPTAERIVSLRDTVGLRALLPEWIKQGSFQTAFDHALKSLSANARSVGMAAICIRAADMNSAEIATKAYDTLTSDIDTSVPAMAMSAMHVRHGNLDAAEPFWNVLERAPATPGLVEPTAMHAVALVGSGHAERGLRQCRQMFARIRESQAGSKQSRMEVIDQIDEAIEVMGHFMSDRGIILSAQASMEMMWVMIDNGGLVAPVAGHLLAGIGPEAVTQLGWDDLALLTQVQAGMIVNLSSLDIAHSARFAHLLEVLMASGIAADQQTTNLVEKALLKIDRPDLAQCWQRYRYPLSKAVYSPAQHQRFAYPAQLPSTPAMSTHEDTFDPYASTTDNKGSVAITDLLEKTYGKSSSHLNEALTKFKNMRRAGRHPRFFTYAKLITAAAKEGRLPLAHDILALARQDVPYLPQYRIVRYGWITVLDAMVAACLTTGQRHLAEQYHQDLLEMGAAPSANTFGLYITTLKESTKTFDEATEAVKVFLRAKSEGVEPSSFLYNALIGKLGKARRIDDCLFYFTEMRQLDVRPTSVTYGTIVNALCRVSDEKFAEELFEEMESMPNYKPRPAPYHSLMQFFLTTKRDRSKVLAYYERMRSKNIQPTTHTYKLLIDTYATLDPVDMAAAEAVLDQIRRAGETPEAVHYASLIHAKGCVLHDMEGAKELFDTVMNDTHVRPQACLYQALFESMVANHQIEGTEEILNGMRLCGVEMTPYIANSLIHGWTLVKNIGKAKTIYDSVSVDKREPSTYEAMTRAFMAVEDRDGAMAVVNEGLSRAYPTAVANKILDLVGGGRTAVSSAVEITA